MVREKKIQTPVATSPCAPARKTWLYRIDLLVGRFCLRRYEPSGHRQFICTVRPPSFVSASSCTYGHMFHRNRDHPDMALLALQVNPTRCSLSKRAKHRPRPQKIDHKRRSEGRFALSLWLIAAGSQVMFFVGPAVMDRGGGHIHVRPFFGAMALITGVGAIFQTWHWWHVK